MIQSDLLNLLSRLKTQIATYHDGQEGVNPDTVTDGNLIGEAVMGKVLEAAHGDSSIVDALAGAEAYTPFDVDSFLRTYPETFGALLEDTPEG